MYLSATSICLWNVSKFYGFGVCFHFFSPAAGSLRRPAARGLKGEKICESLAGIAGGWINLVSVYSYILFCVIVCLIYSCHFVIWCVCMHLHDMTHGLIRCNAHTYLSLFLSLYMNHSCICRPHQYAHEMHWNSMVLGCVFIFFRLRRAPYRESP